MKSYEEFCELQNQYRERLQAVTEAMEAVQFPDFTARRINPDAYHAAEEAAMTTYKPLDEEARVLRIALLVNHDNIKRAMFERLQAAAWEIFTKYDGKPYGPKTAEKIRREMIENCSAYLSIDTHYYSYSNHITWHVLDPENGYYNREFIGDDMTVFESSSFPIVDSFNKIRAANITELSICGGREYVPDPIERARAIIETVAAVNEKIKELNTLQNTFNALIPARMDSAKPVYELTA